MIRPAQVAENFERVRAEIVAIAGAERAATIQVVAVTKTHGVEAAFAAAECGCDAVGENYAQEAVSKFGDVKPLPLHFIGHVQSNKVRSLAPIVDVWQTVDSAGLAREIAKRAPGAQVMLQVNISGEGSKSGCAPSAVEDLLAICVDQGINATGLMTIAPLNGGSVATGHCFKSLRTLADTLGLADCAMGMSSDYAIAVAEGATVLRLGTVLFGPR